MAGSALGGRELNTSQSLKPYGTFSIYDDDNHGDGYRDYDDNDDNNNDGGDDDCDSDDHNDDGIDKFIKNGFL
jgi:hypothetical protein